MPKERVQGLWQSRWRTARQKAAGYLSTGIGIVRGDIPINNKARQLFSTLKGKLNSSETSSFIKRITSKNPAFEICLALFIMFLWVFAVIIPLASMEQAKEQGFSITAPAVPDPDDPDIPARIYLRFETSAAPLDMIDREVASGIGIVPEMPGVWKWESDDSLSFTPAAKWRAGTEYVLSFKKSILAPSTRVKLTRGAFMAPPIDCSFRESEFYVHPEDPAICFLSATLTCNYPASAESVKSAIRIVYGGKNLPFSVKADKTNTAFYIASDSIRLPADSAVARINLDGEIESPSFNSKKRLKDSIEISVPSEREYASVSGADVEYVLDEASRYSHVLLITTRGRTTLKRIADSLEAWVLPKDLPASPGTEAIEDFEWRNPGLIGPEVLKLSKKLALKPEPAENESTQSAAFTFHATPSAYIFVRVKAGLTFNGGYRLEEDHVEILRTEQVPISARFLKEGVLMSSSGEKSLTVISYGIEKIGFRVHRVVPDQVNHLVTQSHGDLSNLQFSGYGGFNETNISKIYEREFTVSNGNAGEPNYTTLDLTDFMESDADARMRYGLFLVDAYRGDENDEGRTRISRRLIMVSDLGFMVKGSANGTREVFVMGVRSGRPVAGASVSVVGKNGLEVLRAVTDAQGHASVPDLSGLKREKAPVAFIVRDDLDMTFLPYDQAGRFLDYSNFDIGGEFESSLRSKISAYLFTDRGLYRPGETARIGIIAKQKAWPDPIKGMRLVLRISDPRGSTVLEKELEPGDLGIMEAKFETHDWSPTGEYQAGVYFEKDKEEPVSIGNATFKIEEFLPDRLRIKASILPTANPGWIKPEAVTASVKLDSLFGNPEQNHSITASVELVPAEPRFSEYEDFEFQVSGEKPPIFRLELPPKATDDEGNAEFALPTSEYKSPLFQLNFYAQGFEKEGGRNVSAMTQALVSPLEFLVGFDSDGSLEYINRDSIRNLRFIAIDPTLKMTAASGLTLTIQKREWVSVLTQQDNGLYKYRSIERKSQVSRVPLGIPADGKTIKLDTGEPGDYEFIIEKGGAELLKRAYSVIGQGNVTRALDQNAELKVKLDKSDYEAGETIHVALTAPYSGTGLITIERDRIYAWKWFSAESSASVQTIELPSGIRGNAYVNVSFIRSSDSREIYMSPLCCGVANFSIARGSLENTIDLDAPSLARPGETLSIKFTADYPGKIIVYGVDEGILQVAKYKLPDPLSYFLRKRALEVSTYQILDLILPNFLDERASPPGGGEDVESLARNLNPFKRKGQAPVAFWSGILECGPGGGVYSYKVPDYFNGSLRIMAVSVGADSLGSTERRTLVKGKLIITPQMPNFISPNDEFTIPVTVTNNIPGSGKDVAVRVRISASPGLKAELGEQAIKASENGDGTAFFKVKASDKPGAASVTFTADCSGVLAEYASEISVRPSVAFRTIVKTGRVAKGKKDFPLNEKTYYPDYRTLELSASYLPLGLSKGLLSYLETYPYGCSEQLLSQAFPKVALYSLQGFESFNYAQVADSVDKICGVLLSRQNSDGSIGLWAASGKGNPFVSAYAAHYLTEAQAKGFYVPASLADRLLAYLAEYARGDSQDWFDAYTKSYGIYVLTRNEKIMADEINALRSWLKRNPGEWRNTGPGLFLAASYSLLKMDGESKPILDALKGGAEKISTNTWFAYAENETAVKAYLHAKHFPKWRPDLLGGYPDRLAESLEGGRISSFNAAITILALAEYSKLSPVVSQNALTVTQSIGGKPSPIALNGKIFLSGAFSPAATNVSIENSSSLPLYIQTTSAGFESAPPYVAESHGVEVYHEIVGADGQKLVETALGAEVFMRTRFRSLKNAAIDDLVIVDLLPGGFDPDIDSIRAISGTKGVEYIDIREDRVIFYLSAKKEAGEITYALRSVSRGTFTMAPSYSVSMNEPAIWSMNSAAAVKVK
jgi:uncharacterized protein YfaS (alpha-2-macroglobulin family)